MALDPNNAWIVRQFGQTMLFQGKPETALSYLERAIRLDPRSPFIFNVYTALGRCQIFSWPHRGRCRFCSGPRGRWVPMLGTFISSTNRGSPRPQGGCRGGKERNRRSGETQAEREFDFGMARIQIGQQGSAIRSIRHCKRRPSLQCLRRAGFPRNESHWANRDDPNGLFGAPSFVAVKDALEPIQFNKALLTYLVGNCVLSQTHSACRTSQ